MSLEDVIVIEELVSRSSGAVVTEFGEVNLFAVVFLLVFDMDSPHNFNLCMVSATVFFFEVPNATCLTFETTPFCSPTMLFADSSTLLTCFVFWTVNSLPVSSVKFRFLPSAITGLFTGAKFSDYKLMHRHYLTTKLISTYHHNHNQFYDSTDKIRQNIGEPSHK